MLKGIPKVISPELIKILMEMGHGDEIVIADGNFPAASCAKRIIRCDGHNVPEILDAVLRLFPLDTASKEPLSVMEADQGDRVEPVIWQNYTRIAKTYEPSLYGLRYIKRHEFYEKARNAYAVVATSEAALYANIILRKGIV